MNIKRILAISRKEIIHIKRDTRSLMLSFLLPLILVLLFGYALSMDIKNIPISILDYDRSTTSAEFIQNFTRSGYFSITDYAQTEKELEENINSGRSLAGIVIPPGFGEDINSEKSTKIQTIIDGSGSNKATIASGYISAISESFSIKIFMEKKISGAIKMPINIQPRIWYNPNLESKNFIIPGLITVIMMIIAALLTSQVIAKEWENGTMEQLIISPVRPFEIIIGKILPYFFIGIIDLSMIIITGKVLFKVYLRGSIFMLFLLSGLFLIGALGLGITISIIAKSQALSYQLALLTSFLPSYILSGLVFPITSMPKIIQYITYLVPARYFMVILRGIFLKASTFMILSLDILYLGIFAFLMFLIARFRLIKKID